MQIATYTDEQLAVRLRVWEAARDGQPIELTADEVRELWGSIFTAGKRLMELRDAVNDAADVLRKAGKTAEAGFVEVNFGRDANVR
jgi:hypothetical protein